jgi:DNA-binding CsgD family transcriptional regulator
VANAAKYGPVGPEVIGREQELAELTTLLAAVDRLPAAVVLEGEPGIGKTILWRAGLELAPPHGYRVLRATPSTAEMRLSFAAVADLLEPALAETLPRLPRPQRHALEVALLLEEAEGQPPDHHAVSVAFLGSMRVLAQEGPLVVAVDDAQWLDAASAFVLEFALRRLQEERVFFLLARRTDSGDEGLPLGLDRAFSERVHRLAPGPLSLGALHRLLRDRLGLVLPRPKLRRLHEVSGGNPFFALELARAVERGSIGLEAGEPLPASLGALVHERLEGLPADTREALLAAAALAQPTLGLVESTVGSEAASTLSPALDAQVVELAGDRIRFAHPLLASGVYGAAPHPERRALHRRLAEVVASSEERARHLALAADGPDADVAATLERAAEEAGSRGAPEVAADLWEQATRLTPAAHEGDAARRTIAGARFRFVAGDTAAALVQLEHAMPTIPPGRLRAEAFITLGRVHQYEGNQPRAVELFEEALNESDDDALRAEASTDLGYTLFWLRERLVEARSHAARGAELARKTGDVGRYARALGVRQVVEGVTGRKEAAAMTEEVSRLGEHGYPGYFLLWTDDADDAARHLRRQRHEEKARGGESDLPLTLVALAVAEYLRGRWKRAAWATQEGLELALQTGERHNQAFALAVRALVRGSRGDEKGCRADAAEAMSIAGERAIAVARIHALWALGVLELSLGRAEETALLLGPHRERLIGAGVGEPGSIRFVPDEIEALIALGRTDEAETLVAWLDERGSALDRASALAAAARCRGLLALARRDSTDALACFEQALNQHARIRLPFDRARTLLAQGIALRQARRRQDARAALDEARRTFASLGAALWEEQAVAELGRIGGRRAAGDELTPAERRVAALVAEGRTNKEVAAALFLAERTVEFHLTHVYRKLGVRSRAELARRVLG